MTWAHTEVVARLATWQLESIPRHLLRAVVSEHGMSEPSLAARLTRNAKGQGAAKNRASVKFQDALRDLERLGLIRRSTSNIYISDKKRLKLYATDPQALSDALHLLRHPQA